MVQIERLKPHYSTEVPGILSRYRGLNHIVVLHWYSIVASVVWCSVKKCQVLFCAVLCCTVFTVLYCNVLYFTGVHCGIDKVCLKNLVENQNLHIKNKYYIDLNECHWSTNCLNMVILSTV